MPGGDEAYPIGQPGPPGFELTQGQPHDGENIVVYGSGAQNNADPYADPPHPTEAQVLAADPTNTPTLGDVKFAGAPAREEPLIGGSAQVLGHQAPQPTAAQVQAMDPNVANLDPGLALPYGNNDQGVTGTIVLAPQTGGPQGSAAINDPDVWNIESVKVLQSNQSDIKTTLPSAPQTGTMASGAVDMPAHVEDRNEGGGQGFAQTPAGTDETFTTDQPHAPQTGGPSGGQKAADFNEGGYAGSDIKPPVQYGQSAP